MANKGPVEERYVALRTGDKRAGWLQAGPLVWCMARLSVAARWLFGPALDGFEHHHVGVEVEKHAARHERKGLRLGDCQTGAAQAHPRA